jgi:nitrogen fixation protein NifQ
MLNPASQMATPEEYYARLMRLRQGHPVEETLARMMSSWMLGDGCMPQWLGLREDEFRNMLQLHFPMLEAEDFVGYGDPLPQQRLDETDDLRKLLIDNRSGQHISELWMAEIVSAGCMGDDHLWQDLGLWQRPDLSRLMLDNFKLLAERNDKDMKWKKFLYKQLCDAEGIYVCRAPSCEVCTDYDNCFGPED